MVLKEVNCKINRLSHALIHASKNMRQFVYDHLCTWKHRLILDYAIIAIIISKVDDAKTLSHIMTKNLCYPSELLRSSDI